MRYCGFGKKLGFHVCERFLLMLSQDMEQKQVNYTGGTNEFN